MSLHINELAPNFQQKSTFGVIDFHKYIDNQWAILFSHPKDFTPVCTTELAEVANLHQDFTQRGVKVLALSVDKLAEHQKWIEDIESYGKTKISYPIIADEDRSVSLAYDMIHPQADDTFTVRSVYFIDPQKKIRLILTYPAQVGRNFDEILRIVDALQKVDKDQVATPVNWSNGKPTIIPASIKDEKVLAEKYGDKNEVFPYLRFTNK